MPDIPDSNRTVPPWTDEEVEALNTYQGAGMFHPFTCGGDRMDEAHTAFQLDHGGDFGQLVATRKGWKCPVCTYRQDWAHKGMISGGRRMIAAVDSARKKSPRPQ